MTLVLIEWEMMISTSLRLARELLSHPQCEILVVVWNTDVESSTVMCGKGIVDVECFFEFSSMGRTWPCS